MVCPLNGRLCNCHPNSIVAKGCEGETLATMDRLTERGMDDDLRLVDTYASRLKTFNRAKERS